MASYIHLGKLPHNRIPSKEEILKTPFDQLDKKDIGRIIFRGTDENNNNIYTLSKRGAEKIVVPALMDLTRILGNNVDNVQIVNTLPAVNILMKIGGFTSRGLKIVWLGRPLVLKGTLDTYNNLINIVKATKDNIKK